MSSNRSFAVGNTVRVKATIRVDDTLTDPTTVTITIEEPDGTDQTPSVSNPSTGVHQATFAPDQTGYHRVKIEGSGNSADFIKERTFYVASSGIG